MSDIRPETSADHAVIRDVVTRAFGATTHAGPDHGEEVAELVEAIRASAHYVASLALVTEVGGRVAGFVMASAATLIDGERRHRVLTLSPLAVAPEHQGQGLGGELVGAVVAAADGLGEPLLLLEGSPAYYGRFGFQPCAPHGITIPLPDWAPSEAAQVRLLGAYDPAIRGRLEYPPAFDAVAAH